MAEWAQHFEPIVWALKHNAPIPDQDHPAAQSIRAFGFGWFVPEILKHKAILRDVLIASAVLMLMGIGTPLLTQVIFDKVVVHETQSTLMVVTSALAILLVFNALMTWLRQYLVIHTGNRIDAVLGEKVFRHLLRLPMLYFQHRPTGTVMARLYGVETIREFLTGAAVTLLLDFPFMVILLVVMFFYSWELSFIALGILGALITASLIVMPAFRKSLNAQFLLGARNQAFVTEHVAGMETVKSLQMEPLLERRYGDYLADYLAANVRTKNIGNSYQVTTHTLEQLQVATILIVGAIIVMRHDGFTIGMLIAFQMFASRLAQPMMRLAGLYQEFQQAHIAVQRLGDVMNCPTEPYGLTPTRQNDSHGHIEIRGLGFRYSEKEPYLYRNLNVSFPPGKTVAIMGPSGSGKSTLTKLLQGFVQPSEGSVRLDGIDIAHLSANELRSQFGVVPQETILFTGTLYDNLLAATPAASFDDIVTSCKAAGIHEFIEQLPKGYQTEVGERGVGLSGGQKQRIAIARALLRRPKILIFDEATASLDPKTAEQIAKTINQLKGRVTVLFIAHQLPAGLLVDFGMRLGSANKEIDGADRDPAKAGRSDEPPIALLGRVTSPT